MTLDYETKPRKNQNLSAELSNTWGDSKRAEAYAKLGFPGTYYLAYRDLPNIILSHVRGKNALDFGCGTGRSTRFLGKIGFNVVGVDISEDMIKKARRIDPSGDYRLIEEGDLAQFEPNTCDLILSVFTFDNIPTMEKKVRNFKEFARLLTIDGKVVNLVSSPEIYVHEWASFSTIDFPENRSARSGNKVKIIVTDMEDKRPVEDTLWTDQYYRETYRRAGLGVVKTYKPLAKGNEPCQWINETKIAPWVIYVLNPTDRQYSRKGN
jgi:ubiquinone/menaquinone biosynthesis C-methylase UbiE